MAIDVEGVRRAALDLPGTFERESYGGRPSWRTKDRMFTWVRDDPEGLVIWVESVEFKEALLGSDSDTFFTTSHYDGLPIVLVNLDSVDPDEAAGLIVESWRLRAPRKLVRAWDAEHNSSDS